MEPQEKVYCCYEKEEAKYGKKKNCLDIITVILLAAFTTVIGLLVGAALSTTILGALASIIVLAIVLGILLILSIILLLCNRKKDKKDKKDKCCY